jgi:penicillin-insensitive murein DD-endopeptidase
MRVFTLVSLVAALALPARAWAVKPTRSVHTKSVGAPNEGQLVGGKQLRSSSSLRAVGSLRWGVPELVDMLVKSSELVAKKHPGSVLTVADLSRRGGGDVDGHKSHESGRDADVAFYMRKGSKPFVAPRFVQFEETVEAARPAGVVFDADRNWTLVEAWLGDPRAKVLQIFVANHLRKELLAAAKRAGASEAVQQRAADVLVQPKNALPHDDHFHVRVACPASSSTKPSSRGDSSSADTCENFAKKAEKPLRAKGAGSAPPRSKLSKGAPGKRDAARKTAQRSTRVKDRSSSKR